MSLLPPSKRAAHLLLPLSFTLPFAAEAQTPASDSADLPTLVMTATRQPMRINEVLADVTVIERAEIERASGSSVAELLARQPGIQMNTSGGPLTTTGLYIRGTNTNQTKVLVDGISINSGVSDGGSPLQYIPLEDIERIEILRGPAATMYGADAVGGVIQLFTKRGQKGLRVNAFTGYGSHAQRQASAGVSGGNEYWRFSVNANHQAGHSISAQPDAINQDADRDPYRNSGASASLSFLPAAGHELGLSYRMNRGMVHHDSGYGVGDYDDRTNFRNYQWQAFSKNRILDNWQSTLQYGETLDDWKVYGAYGATPYQSHGKQASWQNDVRLPLGNLLVVVERQEEKLARASGYLKTPNFDNQAVSLGWTANYGRHSWQLGLRSDDHSVFGQEDTHSVAYGFQFDSGFRAHAAYATAFRAPTLLQLYHPTWGGNENLQPETAKNREFALIWEHGLHTASLTYYDNRVRDLISWSAGQYNNVNKARLKGVTLAYAGQVGAWNWKTSYDWLDAEQELDSGDVPLGRRAKHAFNLFLERDWGKLATGIEVQGVGSRYDRNGGKDAYGQSRLSRYTLVNLTAKYELTKDLSLEGRIDNLLDKDYAMAAAYNAPGASVFLGLRYAPEIR